MTLRGFCTHVWPWLAAATSGVLLSLCYPGYDQPWLCWIALTPLIVALWFAPRGKRPWLKHAVLAWLSGIIFFCMTFSWLTTVTNLMSPQFLGTLGWFGLMAYMSLYFALWGAYMGILFNPARDTQKLLGSTHNLRLALLAAAGWVAQEWLRGTVFGGFGWNNLGVTLYDNIPMIQIADITGVAGLSFLIVICNVVTVLTVRRFMLEVRVGKMTPHFDFTLTLTLIGAIFFYGAHGILKRRANAGAIPLRVTAVQANIPQDEKFDPQVQQKIFNRYERLTTQALATHPDLLLWPEAATPEGMFADQVNFEFVSRIFTQARTNFLLGSIDTVQGHDYNIAALIPKDAESPKEVQVYRKMHLVPFGEYVPFRNSFPVFAKLVGDLIGGDFTSGTEYKVLETHDPAVKIGPLICFEDTLGDLTRHFTLNGAQVLVNITNDAWFLKSVQSRQHVANAVFRAVENRRPLVRCANTGITCSVDVNGRVESTLSLNGNTFIEGFKMWQINVPPADAPLTFYAKHGEWFSICSLILALGVSVAHFSLRRRAVNGNQPATPKR